VAAVRRQQVTGRFLRDVLRRRRVMRQVGEHRAALIDAALGVKLAEHGLFARFVQALVEQKLPAVRGSAASVDVQPVSTLAKLVTSAWE
jgi:hypothetical protein